MSAQIPANYSVLNDSPIENDNETQLKGIAVISDIHIYDHTYDFESIEDAAKRATEKFAAASNRQAYLRVLGFLGKQSQVTDVIINGDLMHAPTLLKLSEDERIKRMTDLLIQMSKKIAKPIHFNLGNHDVLAYKENNKIFPILSFAQKFKEALEKAIQVEAAKNGIAPQITLIGAKDSRLGDFRAIFDYEIRGQKFKISHTPFARSATTIAQAEYFREFNEGAYKKVTDTAEFIAKSDGIIRIQSDSHTPQADADRLLFNTGMLTLDVKVPFHDPSILILDANKGQHYSIPRAELLKKSFSVYEIPKGAGICETLSKLVN